MSLDSNLQSAFTAVGTAVKGKISSTEKGQANGVATLDGTGKIPSAQLPSYVDDVVEYANLATFPATGSQGILYIAIDTNKQYRWSGSAYAQITSGAVDSVAGKTGIITLGTSDITGLDTALTGKEAAFTTLGVSKGGTGATTLTGMVKGNGTGAMTSATAGTDYVVPSGSITGNAGTATKLATARSINGQSFDGSSDVTIPNVTTSVSGVMSGADKTKLDGIATNANNYVHPTTDGSLHVPATSTTNNGKVLMAGSTAGNMSWTSLGISNITGLQTALDGKATSSSVSTLSTNVGATDTNYVAIFSAALV